MSRSRSNTRSLPEDACPEGGTISATALGNHAYGYNAVDFAPSKVPAAMEPIAAYKARRLIQEVNTFDVEWTAVADSTHAMGTSQNEMFVIFGPSKLGEFPEDGATLKRMRTSVDWAKTVTEPSRRSKSSNSCSANSTATYWASIS